jgi:cobalt/nickel transport protein
MQNGAKDHIEGRSETTGRDLVRSFAALAVVAALAAAPAQAHFLQLIPARDVLPDGGTVAVDIRFSHPMAGGPVMAMDRPERVGLATANGIETLGADLEPVTVDGAQAFTLALELARPGGATLFVEPAPYWEPAEGKYIVHHTKVFLDAYATGEGWDREVGLPVEIRPLVRPTGLWTGNLFRGVVLRDGAPVPHAEIEVEYLNDGAVTAPNPVFVTQVIKADGDGRFAYAMPRAGWWGFAALLEAEETMTGPAGEAVPVELGGLIWVRAVDIDGGG